jgi:hypothetical protein
MESTLLENCLLELEEWSDRLQLFAGEVWDETIAALFERVITALKRLLVELTALLRRSGVPAPV